MHLSSRPRVFEFNSAYRSQQINPPRRYADLNYRSWNGQVLFRYSKRFGRRAKHLKTRPDSLGIIGGGIHPDIQISGRSRNALHRQGMGPDDKKAGLGPQKAIQEILEVFVHGLG